MVADALQGAPKNYRTFTLSVNSYPMATSYPSANQGGTYHDENGEDVVSMSAEDGKDGSFFMMDSLRAESYSFDASWQDILNNAHQQTLANGVQVPFHHLFSNLFINLSHADSYNIKQMAVVVTDVEKDFTLFNDWNTAMLNKPVRSTIPTEYTSTGMVMRPGSSTMTTTEIFCPNTTIRRLPKASSQR